MHECYPTNRFEHPGPMDMDEDERCKNWGVNSETGEPIPIRAASGMTCYEVLEQGNSYNPCMRGLQRLCNVTLERIQECDGVLKVTSRLNKFLSKINFAEVPNLVGDAINLIKPQGIFADRAFKLALSGLSVFWKKKYLGGDNESIIVDLMEELRWDDECDCGGTNPSCPPRLGGALSASKVLKLSGVDISSPTEYRSKAVVCSDHWVIDRYRGGQTTVEEIIEIGPSSNEFFGEEMFDHGPDYGSFF